MKIDALVTDPRRRGSTRIMIGARVAWTVPSDLIAQLGLAEGSVLTGDAVAKLEQGADEEGAFRAALRSLERRGHAVRDLSHKLERKGHTEGAVAAAIGRLTRLGLLDDRAFARDYVRTRTERGRGPIRLRHDLRGLGVSSEVIEETLRALPADETDPLALARALAAKRAKQLAGLPRETRRRRLSAFLVRRGYRGGDCKEIVDQLLKI